MWCFAIGRSRKLASSEDLSAALDVVQELAKSEAGQPFAEAVTEFDAPDYSKWVRKPMDLGLIANKLHENQYTSTGGLPAQACLPSKSTRIHCNVMELSFVLSTGSNSSLKSFAHK